jgi:hypothetical protein
MKINMDEVGLFALQASLNEAREWHMISPAAFRWLLRETEEKARLLAAGHDLVTMDPNGDLITLTTGDDDGYEGTEESDRG